MITTKDVQGMSTEELLSHADNAVKEDLGSFIREFNKREWSVRIGKTHKSFEEYAHDGYVHQEKFGYGFVVDGRPVPYFHPNRSFHDEIIWLNSKLYYKDGVSFGDKLVNSAVVKFYGPSRTLDIITGHADDLDYLEKTDHPFINFDELANNPDYEYTVMRNIELAFGRKQQIWGTTELRTSLQTNSRNYARLVSTVIDRKGVKDEHGRVVQEPLKNTEGRKMRPSDMIAWIKYLSFDHERDGKPVQGWINFYSGKPTMEQSFDFLTEVRGIGNYYGYHFSSNLARMPGVGAQSLIEAEWKDEFKKIKKKDKGLTHGNLDENADYVMAGPGAGKTLTRLFPALPINSQSMMSMILAIRDHQEEFFGIKGNPDAERHLREATELGRFTTFGAEIACCQFDVFSRACNDYTVAMGRANAPISKMATEEEDDKMCLLVW